MDTTMNYIMFGAMLIVAHVIRQGIHLREHKIYITTTDRKLLLFCVLCLETAREVFITLSSYAMVYGAFHYRNLI